MHNCSIRDQFFGVNNGDGIMGRLAVVLVDSVSLLTHHHLGLSRFAGLNTFIPSVLKFCVTSRPALPIPRTSTSAATEFAGFRDGATCEACGADGRRRGG